MTTRLAVRFALGILAGVAAACGGDHPPAAPTPPQVPLPAPAPPPPPAQTFTVSGVVRDYSGHPLGGATVSLDGLSTNGPTRSTTTDGGGHYAFDETRGSVQVSAWRDGLLDDRRKLNVTRDTVQDLELTTPLAIDSGGLVTADVHRGPLSSACAGFLSSAMDSCRPITVRANRTGALMARLEWSGAPTLALTEMRPIVPNVDILMFGPTACCNSGIRLHLSVKEGSRSRLLVRLQGAVVDTVRFTLTTAWE